MSSSIAMEILEDNAQKIYHLILNQKNQLCVTICPAFEEIVDTQLFGLSKQVEFAIELGAISAQEGHRLLSDIEYALNNLYADIQAEVSLQQS